MKRRIGIVALSVMLTGAAVAQIHGTPAGATSLGGGHTFANPVGVPAGATSLGPRGFGSTVPRFPGRFGTVLRDGHHVHRVIIPFAVPLYSYGYYPYLYPSLYGGTAEMTTADYPVNDATVSSLTPPQVVVAPVQQPPQIIVIDDRGVHDATDDEREQAIATTKGARKPKLEEPKIEAKPETEDVGPMTVLVFRDGTRREVKNYAIMGKELIVLGAGSLRRIQIAELDVPATQKENDVRGLDFKLP